MQEEEWWVWPLVGVLGLMGLVKLWQDTVRPWIQETWSGLTAGEAALTVPGLGALDNADLVAVGLLALVVLAGVVSVVRARRRRRAEKQEQGGEGPRSSKRGMR